MMLDRSDTAATAAEPVQFALPLAREAPRAAQGKRAIETDLPVLEVNRLAQLESYHKNIYYLA